MDELKGDFVKVVAKIKKVKVGEDFSVERLKEDLVEAGKVRKEVVMMEESRYLWSPSR